MYPFLAFHSATLHLQKSELWGLKYQGGHIQRIPSLAQSLSQSFGHHSSPTGCTVSLDGGIPVKIRYLGMIRTIPWLLGIKTNCLRKHSIYIPTPQWKGWDLWGVQKHPQVFPDFPVIWLNLHVDAISVCDAGEFARSLPSHAEKCWFPAHRIFSLWLSDVPGRDAGL